jgi:hypothetical protein
MHSVAKSGGYRVIYYVRTAKRIVLTYIYFKGDQEDISAEEIQQMIADILIDDVVGGDES